MWDANHWKISAFQRMYRGTPAGPIARSGQDAETESKDPMLYFTPMRDHHLYYTKA